MPDQAIQAVTGTPALRLGGLDGARQTGPAESEGVGGFGDALVRSLEQLDGLQRAADRQSQALAAGQAQDVSQVVMEVERASLALQLAVQVRNRAVDAYTELMRMQI